MTTLLATSTNSYITMLDSTTKYKIGKNISFCNDRPKEFTDNDSVMLGVYFASRQKIFEAIFGGKVLVFLGANKPLITKITYDAFWTMYDSNSTYYAISGVTSVCENCKSVTCSCCEVPGKGCTDSITLSGGSYYEVEPK